MANVKISGLPTASTPLTGAELVPVVQSGVTSQTTVDNLLNPLAETNGSSLVAYLPSGTGAVATTVQAKLRETVSVKDFGAVGDGSDATTAFTNALATGKAVYVPAGTYLLNFVNVPSNTMLFGDGANTIIKPYTPDIRCALGADSGSSSTYIENVTIRNIKFLGDVVASGFNEQKHLTSFNGVKNLLIENCQFVGFRGDGVYIGSGNAGGEERHNINVNINSCFFDGINKDNRNGISIIDVDGIHITNNTFINLTRSNMPGAIDFEPDANAFHIIRNLVVTGNVIKNCGGNVACIQVYMPSTVTAPAYNIVISNNTCEDSTLALGLYINLNRGATYTDSAATLSNNTVKNCLRPFQIMGCSNVTINGNTFRNFKNSALVGYLTTDTTVYSVTVSNNIFSTTSAAGDGAALSIFNANKIIINGNQFIDIGLSTGGGEYLTLGVNSTSSAVTIVNNIFTATDSRSATAVRQQSSHTTTNSINKFYGNTITNNLGIYLNAWLTDNCGNNVNNFTTATAESTFDLGTSITVINGSQGTSTTGNINSGSAALTVVSGTNITNGDQITVAGAGAAGANLITTVLSGGGTTSITLATTASTTVSGVAVTTPGLPSGGFTQGVLTTEKRTNQAVYTAWTTQRYIPRNTTSAGLLESYYRKSDTSGNWSAWVKVTGV